MNFEGIICPIISPFTIDVKVYVDCVRKLIKFFHKNGVNEIFVCGTYGLEQAMSVDERKILPSSRWSMLQARWM